MKRQLALILARAQTPIDWVQVQLEDETDPEEMPEDLLECLSNTKLSAHFRAFGKEVGAEEARTLEEVYKTHLEPTRMFSLLFVSVVFVDWDSFDRAGTTTTVDSARANLAGTFVNAFVNAGFGNDKLMVTAEEGNSWIYKNKEHGTFQLIRIYQPIRRSTIL
jgi:26S proteasome regulatory subunit N1